MMMSLFSLFDPSCSVMNLSWFVLLLVPIMLPDFFWSSAIFFIMLKVVVSFVKMEAHFTLPKAYKGAPSLLVSIFFFILSCNLFSLFPHIFSSTSHLSVTLPLAFSLWVGVIFFSLYSSWYLFLAHLVPSGTPFLLLSFMVVVELISNLIRPIALTFRLTANMMAGHLILSLVGGGLLGLGVLPMLLGSLGQVLLITIELGVSFIQAYVFSTLVLLYLSEVQEDH